MSLTLPALRERSDKGGIINSVLISENSSSDDIQIEPQAYQLLLNYHWPGNIRQLKSVLKYALALKERGAITLNDLPEEIMINNHFNTKPLCSDNQVNTLSSSNVQNANGLLNSLREHKWNVTAVAEELGICRSTIYRKMKKLNIIQPNDVF